jgi:hypothetical protein
MRTALSSILFLLLFQSLSYCQQTSRVLTIYSITEYVDGYVIRGIDESKRDTVSIVSVKVTDEANQEYKKILVGEKYKFELEDIANNMAAVPPNNFVVRIKTTVVWKQGDGIKNMPSFSTNTKGIRIKD